jgi:hypothetical protein
VIGAGGDFEAVDSTLREIERIGTVAATELRLFACGESLCGNENVGFERVVGVVEDL